MKMKTHPGRSIFVPSGNAYHADDKGIIHNVLGDDSYDLMRAGNIEQWFEPAPAAAPPPPPATPPAAPKAPPPVAPAAAAVPAKNDGPAAQ